MSALVRIAGGAFSGPRAVPVLRLIQGGATAVGGSAAPLAGTAAGGGLVGAAGAVGAVVGPVAALLAAFALGFQVGKSLVDLWNWLNQALREMPGTIDPEDPSTWPRPGPGYVVGYWFNVLQGGVFQFSSVSVGGPPSVALETGPPAWDWVILAADGRQVGGLSGLPKPSVRLTGTFTSPGGGLVAPPGVLQGTPIDRETPLLPFWAPVGPDGTREGAPDLVPVVPVASVPPSKPVIPSAPSGDPVVTPAPIIAPAPAVTPAVPAGVPGPATQPGELPAITPGPGTAPAPTPVQPTFPQVDPARPPQPLDPAGVPVVPVAPAVPVTPPDIVTEGGISIGDPGARPRPDLDSIARELGRQEQKLAGLLSGLGYPEAFDNLLELLTSINTGTTYSLHPPCGTDANGDPLPPVEVIVPPTIGVNQDVLARLDALAMLLDEHKTMRQPVCKGVTTGRPVTVTFVEAE